MIVMKGVCCMCDDGKEKQLAKRKPPLCGYHYKMEQQKKSAEKNKNKPPKIYKPLKRTPLTYIKKPTGELKIFKEIWEERPHESFINGENIAFFDVSCFAHVLAKGENKYPKFKLYKKNIALITREQHHKWDKCLRSELKKDSDWDKMFDLEDELKVEYFNIDRI